MQPLGTIADRLAAQKRALSMPQGGGQPIVGGTTSRPTLYRKPPPKRPPVTRQPPLGVVR